MKKIFTLLLFLCLTFTCFSQSSRDSISILNRCKWQLSAGKYPINGKHYQVFLDIDKNDVFIITREKIKVMWFKRNKFEKVYL